MTGYKYCVQSAKRLFDKWGLVWSEHEEEFWDVVRTLQRAASRGYDDK